MSLGRKTNLSIERGLRPKIIGHLPSSMFQRQSLKEGDSNVKRYGTRKLPEERVARSHNNQCRLQHDYGTRLPTLGASGTPRRIARSRLVPS